jgi:hypothetical protein
MKKEIIRTFFATKTTHGNNYQTKQTVYKVLRTPTDDSATPDPAVARRRFKTLNRARN